MPDLRNVPADIPEIIRFHEENLLSGPGGFSVSQVHMQDLYSHTCEDFDGSKVTEYDAIAFGCPAMGDEVLEDTEFEPMFDGCKDALFPV